MVSCQRVSRNENVFRYRRLWGGKDLVHISHSKNMGEKGVTVEVIHEDSAWLKVKESDQLQVTS